MDRRELGRRGEEAAAAYLERVGLRVEEMNWRTSAGELDIVAWEGPDLVLVEVKTRRSLKMGTPEEAVSPAKQRRLARLARGWLSTHPAAPRLVRFDVVTIRVLSEDRALLRHHRNAFAVPMES